MSKVKQDAIVVMSAQTTNNNSSINSACLITLETQSNIKNRGGKVFHVKDAKGKTLQLYDAESLAKWLAKNPAFPHKAKPTPEQLTELQGLVSGFVPYKGSHVKNTTIDMFRQVGNVQPVNAFLDLQPQSLQAEIKSYLINDFNRLHLPYMVVTYNQEQRALNENHGSWFNKCLYDAMQEVRLVQIVIDSGDVVSVVLRVKSKKGRQTETHMIKYQIILQEQGSTFYKTYREIFVPVDISGSAAINHKEVYKNNEGELIFQRQGRNTLFIEDLGILSSNRSRRRSGGASTLYTYNGKKYTTHTGPRGGKYIVVDGRKHYLN